ncbi:MAG: hypothetical protein HW386_294 [Gammaproteobacteria bacterium]|nr:hypothetical protein [Gammaproteobacteria bacterium]
MHIRFVKKIKADGNPCRKCIEVEQRLKDAGLLSRIDQIVVADEADPQSEGMRLAREYKVETAPFFIVENEVGATAVYTIYFKFLKEVLQLDPAQKHQVA